METNNFRMNGTTDVGLFDLDLFHMEKTVTCHLASHLHSRCLRWNWVRIFDPGPTRPDGF